MAVGRDYAPVTPADLQRVAVDNLVAGFGDGKIDMIGPQNLVGNLPDLCVVAAGAAEVVREFFVSIFPAPAEEFPDLPLFDRRRQLHTQLPVKPAGEAHMIGVRVSADEALETAGVTISEADKVLHLTQSILNDKLAAGSVSHIVADNRLSTSFLESVIRIMSTAAHLKIIGHESEGGNNWNQRNISKVNSQNQNCQRLERLAR